MTGSKSQEIVNKKSDKSISNKAKDLKYSSTDLLNNILGTYHEGERLFGAPENWTIGSKMTGGAQCLTNAKYY